MLHSAPLMLAVASLAVTGCAGLLPTDRDWRVARYQEEQARLAADQRAKDEQAARERAAATTERENALPEKRAAEETARRDAAEATRSRVEAEQVAEQQKVEQRTALAAKVRADREAAERLASRVKGPKPYLGPLGLLWGQTIDEVRATLTDRLALEGEGEADSGLSYVLRYSGSFAGFPADLVEVGFFEGTLLSVTVVLREPDARPAHRRWESVVKAMSKTYGPAKSMASTPVSPARRLTQKSLGDPRPTSALYRQASSQEADDAWLAAEIQAGRWLPSATWSFSDARVMAGVVVKDPDANGLRSAWVYWAFTEWPRYGRFDVASEAAKAKARDF